MAKQKSFDARNFYLIDGPSGECPYTLTGCDRDTVLEWINNIQIWGRPNKRAYSETALKYWARHFFPLGTEEYRQICLIINEVMYREPEIVEPEETEEPFDIEELRKELGL